MRMMWEAENALLLCEPYSAIAKISVINMIFRKKNSNNSPVQSSMKIINFLQIKALKEDLLTKK